jgi:hypothetical protein
MDPPKNGRQDKRDSKKQQQIGPYSAKHVRTRAALAEDRATTRAPTGHECNKRKLS